MKKMLAILFGVGLLAVNGCAILYPAMKVAGEASDEFCGHSPEHRALVIDELNEFTQTKLRDPCVQ